MLSVVVPAYNEAKNIALAAARLTEILTQASIDHELIFVDDGSRDDTWENINRAHAANPRVRGVCFSRNFGKEAAIFAGLEEARGDCVAVIDCDLQHPPEKLAEMYALWQEGYEVVNGVKSTRGDESAAHHAAARGFYRIMSRAIGMDMTRSSDFKLMDRRVVATLLSLPERRTFFRALVEWSGFKSAEVTFDVEERQEGSSKFSTWSLMRYAMSNITSYTAAPLYAVLFVGLIFLLFAIALGAQTLYHWFIGHAIGGFTTVILLLLIIGSMQLIGMGVVGYYIAKIYDEIKKRPRYIVSRTLREEEKDG